MPQVTGTKEYRDYLLRMKLQRRLPVLKASELPALGLVDVVDEYVDRHKKQQALVVIFRLRHSGEFFKMRKADAGLR